MSQIARVFAVLNLVLAAGFLFAAGTFLGTKNDWIKKLDDEKVAHATDNRTKDQRNAELTASLSEITGANTALKEKNAAVDAKNVEQKARIEALEAELATKNTQIAGLTNDVASTTDAVKRGQDELKRVTDKNLELVSAVKTAQDNEQKAKQAETTAKGTIVERDNAIAALEREKKTLEDKSHEQALIIEHARTQGVDIGKALKMDPVDARVIGVDQNLRLVQFNAGSNQKVAKGYTIDVVRGGTYIGRVRIDQVYPDSSAGTLMYAKPGEAPMVGDRGTNTLN
jgi:uncharacterized coiled-coil protein SlyX